MPALLTVLGFCAVALLVYVTRWSGRIRVEQARRVAAPVHEVRARVVDLKRWAEWNPWCEDGGVVSARCSAVADAVGSACSWSRPGDSVAAVAHRRIDGRGIVQGLRFREPFPFRARGTWSFAPAGDGTLVTWDLRGRVAFPLRAFAATVQGALAFDLRYGLDRLAALLERDAAAVGPVAYVGVQDMPPVRYAYRPVQSRLDGVAQAVEAAARDLAAELARAGVATGSVRLAVYLQTDVKRRTTRCRAAVSLDGDAPDDVPVAEMRAHRAFVACAPGDGASLELAWYLAMRRLRAEGFEPDLSLPPFERRAPSEGGPCQSAVELCIPVKPPGGRTAPGRRASSRPLLSEVKSEPDPAA
ncbi:MAG TPA: SRPBCC family protein [Caldimonas sp.]|nr:SRPBCC family protein [Caldimonas sp.]